MDIIKYLRYPAFALAFSIRAIGMAVGLLATGMSLVADGADRTPPMFRWLLGNVENIPSSWTPDKLPKYSYAIIPVLAALAWYGYGNWHPLVAIYFIFATGFTTASAFSKSKWAKFWWMAIRNPIEGLDGLLEQPIPERVPNPDETVRNGFTMKAVRKMVHGIFWEYWSLSRIEKGRWKGQYWEFRIGWKFVDGNKDFVPTIQFGPKK